MPPALMMILHLWQYEPELFPGLIYRMKEPKVVLLIFVSGKVVLTGETRACLLPLMPTMLAQYLAIRRMYHAGAKRREDLFAAFEKIYPVLQEFRKGAMQPQPQAVSVVMPPQVTENSFRHAALPLSQVYNAGRIEIMLDYAVCPLQSAAGGGVLQGLGAPAPHL